MKKYGGGSKSWQSDGTTLPGLVFMVGKCVELEEIRLSTESIREGAIADP